ncbi:SRPBCC family protein [Sphingomonas sp.]|uniref:SRPBCC family protein n=1 Tax=Sphingomonas sp. TaxID=28214 RepID=UPI0025D3239E|nr:SRPBCC family protein [Sphingomonas sp.]
MRALLPIAPLAIALVTGLVAASPVAAADYVTIVQTNIVDRPVDAVWAKIGGYCAIADWLKVTCELTSGTGEVGTVRRLNGTTVEPMVAKTATSYAYWQSAGTMTPYQYHGSLVAEPAGKGRTKLIYTLFYDASLMPSDAVRESEHKRLEGRFGGALAEMKRLAEAK